MGASEGKENVRISKELSNGEQKATASRKKEIKKVLTNYGILLDEAKIPNIAVLGSGGGLRAMIALYGTLSELKKCGLLDYVMYLCGVSGSTWCMSTLYKNEDWAKNTEDLETLLRKIFTSHSWELTKAIDATREAVEDECYSLTDFWSYFVVYGMLKELHESILSDQEKACENGKNPYPIYAAVDKHTYKKQSAESWFEFTPHEVGVLGIQEHPGMGAYIATENFGSKFNEGKMVEKKKERNISFLQGLWGSALGSEEEIMKAITDALWNFIEERIGRCFVLSPTNLGDLKLIRMNEAMKNSIQKEAHLQDNSITNTKKLEKIIEAYRYLVELQLLALEDKTRVEREVVDIIGNILQRYASSESYELFRKLDKAWLSGDAKTREEAFIKLYEALDKDFEETQRGRKGEQFNAFDYFCGLLKIVWKTSSCIFGWTWGTTNNFMMNCCDVEADHLKNEKKISLMDAGVAINSAYPFVLHPKRNVKLILSFDFSAGGPFETLYRASEYCKVHDIPFPDINKDELKDNEPSNCHIFNKGKDLTIMHFPLFNKDNCKGKIDDYWNTYKTFKIHYSEEEITNLLRAATDNVKAVKEKIREEIKRLYGHSS